MTTDQLCRRRRLNALADEFARTADAYELRMFQARSSGRDYYALKLQGQVETYREEAAAMRREANSAATESIS